MNDPDVYETNVELGLWSPIPWYYPYFQAADRANCAPWELVDEWTPREFWFEASLIVAQAEADHSRYLNDKHSRASTKQQSPGVVGKALKKLGR